MRLQLSKVHLSTGLLFPRLSTQLSPSSGHGCIMSCYGLQLVELLHRLFNCKGELLPHEPTGSTKRFGLSAYGALHCLATGDFNRLHSTRRVSFDFSEMGFEPTTVCFRCKCSTIELFFPRVRAPVIVAAAFDRSCATQTRNLSLWEFGPSSMKFRRAEASSSPSPIYRYHLLTRLVDSTIRFTLSSLQLGGRTPRFHPCYCPHPYWTSGFF